MINLLIPLVILVVVLVGMNKALEKAGQPGWSIFIPIYNIIILFKVAGRNDWWAIIIPIYNIIVMWQVSQEVAKRFGKESGFGAGLFFIGGIFWPILGFGDAVYQADDQAGNDEVLDA